MQEFTHPEPGKPREPRRINYCFMNIGTEAMRGYTTQWPELPVARKIWGTNFESLMMSLGRPNTGDRWAHRWTGCTKAHTPHNQFLKLITVQQMCVAGLHKKKLKIKNILNSSIIYQMKSHKYIQKILLDGSIAGSLDLEFQAISCHFITRAGN